MMVSLLHCQYAQGVSEMNRRLQEPVAVREGTYTDLEACGLLRATEM